MYLSFGANIKKFRTQIGMTQDELAKKVGYKNRQSISMIEKGKTDVPSAIVKALASALGVSIEDLIVLSPEEKRENEIYEFLPFLLKAQDWQLDAIRKILDMPKKTEEEIEK